MVTDKLHDTRAVEDELYVLTVPDLVQWTQIRFVKKFVSLGLLPCDIATRSMI